MSTAPERINALYRRWLFGVWHGDFAAAHEIFAPGFVGHWPDHDVHGPEGMVAQVKKSRRMFVDIENTLDVGPVIAGDTVAAHWTFYGSYAGGIPNATAAPGTRVSLKGSDVMRVDGERIVEYWTVSDALGLMTQLGAIHT